MRIDSKLVYFDALKHKLLTNCQIKIAYSFRKFMKKKRIRLAKEAAAKAKKLAAKKGKKGKATKKGKKKATTMTPKENKEITILKDRTADSPLEPGLEEPSVILKVDGVEVENEENEGDLSRPPSNQSKKSKGTNERNSDDEDDDE